MFVAMLLAGGFLGLRWVLNGVQGYFRLKGWWHTR